MQETSSRYRIRGAPYQRRMTGSKKLEQQLGDMGNEHDQEQEGRSRAQARKR